MLEKIQTDMKNAMKAGDKEKVTALRVLIADIQKEKIAKRDDFTESDMLSVITRMVKSRKESIEEFSKAGRDDLVKKEETALAAVEVYLPKQLSEEEVKKAVEELIKETGAEGMKDFGNVMKEMMSRYQGQVDGKTVNALIKAKLAG